MKLIKTRPRVKVYLPSEVRVDERVSARIVLEAARPARVEGVRAWLEGVERISLGGGQHARRREKPLIHLVATLLGETTLEAGKTELRCNFDLPPSLPPSYQGRCATTQYLLTVHVDIPWWLDRKQKYVTLVRAKARELADDGPSLHATADGGPQGRDPHFELSLSSNVVVPGQVLRGQLAPYNTAFNRYETAKVSLVGSEAVFDQLVEAHRYAVEVSLDGAAEGASVPFAMKLPEQLPPTTKSSLWSLAWQLEVKVELGWRRDLTAAVPLTIGPSGSMKRARERAAPLAIGSARVQAIWQQVAEQVGLAFDEEQHELTGSVGSVALVIRREHSGADGLFLVAELRFASLHLGLDGGEAGSLRRVFGGGVKLGDAAWDRRHYLTGREDAQVASFAQALTPAILPLRLFDARDEQLLVRLRDAGQSRAKLLAFIRTVATLARRIPAAREAIVPPAAMTHAVESWQRLALRLGTDLELARMAVDGHLDDVAVVIATVWSPAGEALHTAIEVVPPVVVDERSEVSWRRSDGTQTPLDRLPQRSRELFEGLAGEALELHVTRDRWSLWLEAPVHEALPLVDRTEDLLAFGASLHGDTGPYR